MELSIDEPIAEKVTGLQRLKDALHLRLIWSFLVDLVVPPKCLTCSSDVVTGASLCLVCWQKLSLISEPVCDALGTPFEYDQGDGALSAAAIADPPAWEKGRAAAAFNEVSRQLIHLLKYQDKQEAGIAMARMMIGAGQQIIAESDVVVPVPLHRFRLWQRRFNQSAFLAERIATDCGKPCHMQLIIREKRTRQQVGLNQRERQKNVGRAFRVAPELLHLVAGKTILLVDDVRTTGATLEACAKTLKDSGALHVHVLTFALVLEPARLHIGI